MSRQRRILFFTYHFPYPEDAGSFRPWVEAHILREIGHDVTVITTGVNYITGESAIGKRAFKVERRDGIKIIKVFTLPYYRHTGLTRIINYIGYAVMAFFVALFQPRPDRIFVGTTSYFITFSSFLYRAVKARGVPFVVDERDLFLDSSLALGALKKGTLYRVLSMWDRFFRSKAEYIMTVSETMKMALVEKGVPQDKIKVVPSIDVDLARGDMAERLPITQRLFSDDNNFLIVYTGSFGMANDLMTILRAAQSLRDSHPDIRFVLIGGGEKISVYQEYARSKGLHNVKIIPARGRDETRGYLSFADVCIHALKKNRLWHMALSSKIFDYLLLKKPILFCGEGEIRQLIEHSGAGLCAGPQDPNALADEILKLYSQREKLSEMGQQGYQYVKERYPIENIYASFNAGFSGND